MRIDKKNYPQVYLKECKYKTKRIQMPRFINADLYSDSDDDSDDDSDSYSDDSYSYSDDDSNNDSNNDSDK